MTHPAPETFPTRLAAVPASHLRQALSTHGVTISFGAMTVRLRSSLPEAAASLQRAYANHPSSLAPGFADTSISMLPGRGPRRWVRPEARIEIDGIQSFDAFPRRQLLPHLEWAVNWAFASMMNAHLLLHSGVVEVGGKGVMLIAEPGSGKSTLTAGLVCRGARLLSDEFGVVRTRDGLLLPMAKPIALKNRSIATIREWSPDASIGPVHMNTRKGNLAHMAVPESSAASLERAARPSLLIFPKWREGISPSLTPVAHARAFMELAANSFNYEILGPRGFEAVAMLVESCRSFRFEYGRLEDGVAMVQRLCDDPLQTPTGAEILA